uniref:Phosphoribosyltransferase domain-containing protein n=1 Tax=Esox lucius TaxID=8010 RepID=A0A3P8XG80_ESOLU
MPCQNQPLNNLTTGQEHNLTKHVRFAANRNSSGPEVPSAGALDDVRKLCVNVPNGGGLGPEVLNLGPQLRLLPLNNQILELQTIIRDKSTSRGDFVFCADRRVSLFSGHLYEGVKFERGNCGVSIMRSGEAMEQGLRDCCRSIRIGKILIQSDEETQKAKVYYAKFPPDISRRKVLLMYPILSSGNTVIEAVKVLIEHGLQPKHIILLSLFSTPHGSKAILQEFPDITLLSTELHPVAPTHFGQKYFGTE